MILAAMWENLENMTLSERNQTLKPHIERLHLYERSKMGKSSDRRDQGGRNEGRALNELVVSFCGDENALKLLVVLVAQLCKVLKTNKHCIA